MTPYINDVNTGNMNAGAITSVGGSQPHTNFLTMNFCIALQGVYPPRS